ncbi:MAG: hypothetical protein AB1540_14745 [Bdellovibrionota bacterium]
MAKLNLQFVTLLLSIWASNVFASDTSDCERRIYRTQMIFTKNDPKIICKDNPSREVQDCLIEILSSRRGRLRNSDLFEVYAVCKVDPRTVIRTCMVKGLDKPWNDKAYKGARVIGNQCLNSNPRPVKASKQPRQAPSGTKSSQGATR